MGRVRIDDQWNERHGDVPDLGPTWHAGHLCDSNGRLVNGNKRVGYPFLPGLTPTHDPILGVDSRGERDFRHRGLSLLASRRLVVLSQLGVHDYPR